MALTLSKHNHRRCPPCKAIAPEIEKLAKEHEGAVVFLKVDVDKAEDAAADNGISAMPTFILFKDEKKVDEVIGADLQKIKSLIAKNK